MRLHNWATFRDSECSLGVCILATYIYIYIQKILYTIHVCYSYWDSLQTNHTLLTYATKHFAEVYINTHSPHQRYIHDTHYIFKHTCRKNHIYYITSSLSHSRIHQQMRDLAGIFVVCTAHLTECSNMRFNIKTVWYQMQLKLRRLPR